jgi:hypothetical protein
LLPIHAEAVAIESGYRMVMVVQRCVIAEKLLRIHEAQGLTDLRLSGLSLGFLLKWNHWKMVDGMVREVYSRG